MNIQQSPGKCLFIGGSLDGEWHTPARTTVKIPITEPVSVSVWIERETVPYRDEIYSHWILSEQDLGRVDLMIESQLSQDQIAALLHQRGFRIRTIFRSV